MKPCFKCGECCSKLKVNTPPLTPTAKEFYLARGFHVYKESVVIPTCICPHLTKEKLCDIYSSRPYVCRTYACKKRGK